MGVGTAIVGSASATQPQTWSCTQVIDYKDSEPAGSARQIYGLILLQTALTLSLTAQVIYDLAFSMENYSKKI